MEERIQTLQQRHHEVDDAVRRELARPSPNSMTLRALKKVRLKLKDQIATMMRSRNFQPVLSRLQQIK